jgi:ATP-dependent helicase/nuclease subunit A
MAGRKWTPEQQQVIDSGHENLLVSAAAGSGKTAVLVEHILNRIMDGEDPVDVDELVVVTFTRAAAAEMRERILQRLQQELELQPENLHLQRQTTLIHNAQITTIDSFCGYVVRNHFHEIDLDPDYRIGEEGELKLMKAQVMDAVMEKAYQQAQEDRLQQGSSPFLELVDAYGRGNKDGIITDMILQLYEKAQSYPWPGEWLQSAARDYQINSVDELLCSGWFENLVEKLRIRLQEMQEETKRLLDKAREPQGPDCYEKGLRQDMALYETVLSQESTGDFFEAFCQVHYGTIGRKPTHYEKDEALLIQVKNGRDAIKKQMDALQQAYGGRSPEDMLRQMQYLRPFAEELIRLTEEFTQAFDALKRRKNVMDFNDIEHFALAILRDPKTHDCRPAAWEFQRHFKEIIVDEYQDSNYIQEAILTAISRQETKEHNMFMVGDVKQSIYSFRQACPEIFMEKYQHYGSGMEGCRRIDLHKNFRSRKEVLSFANDVFFRLMKEDLGHITYDEETALYPGAEYYEEVPGMYDTRILVGQQDADIFAASGVEDKIEFEAKLIADEIRRMREGGMLVTDGDSGKLRSMEYRDVVILMRSPNKQADSMIRVLRENGVPAFAESKTGYFNTIEVETVLNLLRVLDNPLQEIPLAAVLHSPIFGFSNDDLAKLKNGDTTRFAPVQQFLDHLRQRVADMPIHEFIEMVLAETGYLTYVSAMPGGENRRRNLEKLIDQAVAYEKTSFKGLFHFVRYIEQCQKYEVDMGEATDISAHDDAVAILSIHKSKGLEYPICFVSGTGRQFNKKDLSQSLVIHGDLGIGLDLIRAEEQTKEEAVYKKVVIQNRKWDLYGEEMRILYVALTRAKEKLIITGVIPKTEETLEAWQQQRGSMSFGSREKAKSYLEWLVRATAHQRDKYPITIVTPEQVVWEEVSHQMIRQNRKGQLLALAREADEAQRMQLEEQWDHTYAYAGKESRKTKYSVSEIKHAGMEQLFTEEEGQRPAFLKKEKEPVVPAFIAGEQQTTVHPGALRGTAMHRFMECFDFARENALATPEEQRQEMRMSGRLSPEEDALLSENKIKTFMESELAGRMHKAAAEGKLFTEKPFVMGVLAEDGSGERVLIQGIIDVFFQEDDHLVLLDYKTDRVTSAEELKARYEVQLRLYRDALEMNRQLPVTEMLIYSFCLDQTIAL